MASSHPSSARGPSSIQPLHLTLLPRHSESRPIYSLYSHRLTLLRSNIAHACALGRFVAYKPTTHHIRTIIMSQRPSTPVKVPSSAANYTPATLDPDLRSQINTILLKDGHITKLVAHHRSILGRIHPETKPLTSAYLESKKPSSTPSTPTPPTGPPPSRTTP